MIRIHLRSIHCNEETNEVGADEPYVLVTAVNLAATGVFQGFAVPAFDVVRYSFDDVDDEETHDAPGASQSFWGINGRPASLTDPDNAIFVVSLMENDNGDPEALRGIVKSAVGGSVLGSLTASRADKVAALIRDVNSAMGVPTGFPNVDDKIGLRELRFSADELRRAEAGERVPASINIDGDGGRYELTFEASNRPIVTGRGALDVFWIGPDGAIGTTWANPQIDGGTWHQPFPISPAAAAHPNSSVAAITRFAGAMDVFWVGPDGAVATTWENPQVDGANWHTPFPISSPQAARSSSPLAAITRFDGALDVFWIGPDGGIGTTWANPKIDNGAWHPPFPIAPPAAAAPGSTLSVVVRFDGAMDVFWVGPNGAVATTWENPQVERGDWRPPFAISPAGAARSGSRLAAVTRLGGALDVFWAGPDGGIGTTWANPQIENGAWHHPFPISPAGASVFNSSLAAVTRFAGVMDVFWIDPEGAVATTWENPQVERGAWRPPFTISPAGAARSGSPLAVVTR